MYVFTLLSMHLIFLKNNNSSYSAIRSVAVRYMVVLDNIFIFFIRAKKYWKSKVCMTLGKVYKSKFAFYNIFTGGIKIWIIREFTTLPFSFQDYQINNMEPVSTIDPNNEDCNNGLHHTNGGHSTASKGSFDITSRVLFEKKSDKRVFTF